MVQIDEVVEYLENSIKFYEEGRNKIPYGAENTYMAGKLNGCLWLCKDLLHFIKTGEILDEGL